MRPRRNLKLKLLLLRRVRCSKRLRSTRRAKKNCSFRGREVCLDYKAERTVTFPSLAGSLSLTRKIPSLTKSADSYALETFSESRSQYRLFLGGAGGPRSCIGSWPKYRPNTKPRGVTARSG